MKNILTITDYIFVYSIHLMWLFMFVSGVDYQYNFINK